MSAELPRGSLVTGGAHGIGLAISRALAARGDAVVIADLDGSEATAQAELLRAVGHEARAVELDVTDVEQVRATVAAVDLETPLGTVVCNAGIAYLHPRRGGGARRLRPPDGGQRARPLLHDAGGAARDAPAPRRQRRERLLDLGRSPPRPAR